MIPFSIIVAVDENFGIGKNDRMPWHLPADLKHFKGITISKAPRKNVVIIGRKTWDSIPAAYRPLGNRLNIVLSSKESLILPEGVFLANSFDQALELAAKHYGDAGEIFVIGGAKIFEQSIKRPGCQKIYLTRVKKEFDCDTFFPKDLSGFRKVCESSSLKDGETNLSFSEYVKV